MPVPLSRRYVAAALGIAISAAVVLGAATAARGGARRATLACGSTITASTTLTADVNCSSGDGVRIGASHVTLNLNGHLIAGNGSAATGVVVNPGSTSATVENGRITGFNGAVVLEAASGKVQGIRGWANTYGVVSSADFAVITGNTLFDDLADGIRVFSGQKAQITGNTVRENTSDGIFVAAAAVNATITGNKAISNNENGIDLDGPGAHVTANIANGNTLDGILVNDDTASIGSNIASYNTKLGIDASAGDIDGGTDKATGNGSAHQCRNAVC
jgi:parallel beta-helix repeat protein